MKNGTVLVLVLSALAAISTLATFIGYILEIQELYFVAGIFALCYGLSAVVILIVFVLCLLFPSEE